MRKSFVLAVLLAMACNSKKASVAEENFLLKPAEFQNKFASTPGAMLLDVRTLDEVRQEHIKGATNFDFNLPQFDILIAGLDKSKPYFVYCASGVRSAKAAEKMRDLEIQNVYLLDGGIKAWKAAGLPTLGSKTVNQ